MNPVKPFFGGWDGLWHTLVLGVLGYAMLIVLVRVAGKRSLAKMNAYDLIVTVAIGSALANMMLSKDTDLAQGVLGVGILIGLQHLISWSSLRSKRICRLVRAEPSLVIHNGRILPGALKRDNLIEEEVRAAIRAHGLADLGEVWALVLETDGSFSVVPSSKTSSKAFALEDVSPPEAG